MRIAATRHTVGSHVFFVVAVEWEGIDSPVIAHSDQLATALNEAGLMLPEPWRAEYAAIVTAAQEKADDGRDAALLSVFHPSLIR